MCGVLCCWKAKAWAQGNSDLLLYGSMEAWILQDLQFRLLPLVLLSEFSLLEFFYKQSPFRFVHLTHERTSHPLHL